MYSRGNQSDLARLANSVEEQTQAMTRLIALLEPKQSLDIEAGDKSDPKIPVKANYSVSEELKKAAEREN